MKSADILEQLSKEIPKYTPDFSSYVAVQSIVPTGSIALVTSNSHGIIENQRVAINGAHAPVQIDVASFLRTGTTATFETLQDHDFTLSERDKASGGKTLTIIDANEAEFNGSFSIIKVHNRRKLSINVLDSGSLTISGAAKVDDANGALFNGLFTAVNVTANTFEYTLPIAYALPATGNITVQTEIRISAVLDFDYYLRAIYTKYPINDNSLVVQVGDVVRSKNKDEKSDASDSTTGNYAYNPKLTQQFAVYIIQNMTDTLGGAAARDKVESEYIPALFKALERCQLDSGFTYSEQKVIFEGHGGYAFDDAKGKAIYAHEVTFTMNADIDRVADTFNGDINVAMRDVDYSITTDLGTGLLLASVDLDEEPTG